MSAAITGTYYTNRERAIREASRKNSRDDKENWAILKIRRDDYTTAFIVVNIKQLTGE